jgi:hypothetical protein
MAPVACIGPVTESAMQPAEKAGLFLSEPSFAFAGHVFRCDEPGVYRFWSPQLGSLQRVRLASTPDGIASVAAELGALGNLDRDKPWPVMERIAGHQRLLMHCVQFSNLAVNLAARAGLSGRSWLMWNYEAAAAGDLLPSHAITELSCPKSGESRLYDLSFGVELTVRAGRTDFAGYQCALLTGRPVPQVTPIAHAFGFEYASRFIDLHHADFDLDALAAEPALLLEAHRRLAAGAYVIGVDRAERAYVTRITLARAARAPDALPDAKRASLKAAEAIGPSPPPDLAEPGRSAVRAGAGVLAWRIAEGRTEPLPPGDRANADAFDPQATDTAGIILSSGADWRIGDTCISLRAEGLYRLRATPGGPAHQAIVLRRDPARFVAGLLEAAACGGLHDDLPPDDLRLAARHGKLEAGPESVLRFVTALLDLPRIPYRLWRLPAPAPLPETWPLSRDLTLLEIGDGEGRPMLTDLARGMVLLPPEDAAGFAALEEACMAGKALDVRPLCATPRFGYGHPDRKSGRGTDLLHPFWYGDRPLMAALWEAALREVPALGRTNQGRACTTAASKDKARRCLKAAGGAGHAARSHSIAVLDAPAIAGSGS